MKENQSDNAHSSPPERVNGSRSSSDEQVRDHVDDHVDDHDHVDNHDHVDDHDHVEDHDHDHNDSPDPGETWGEGGDREPALWRRPLQVSSGGNCQKWLMWTFSYQVAWLREGMLKS